MELRDFRQVNLKLHTNENGDAWGKLLSPAAKEYFGKPSSPSASENAPDITDMMGMQRLFLYGAVLATVRGVILV